MGDLISRQAAIDAIEQMQMPIMRSEFSEEQFVFTGMSEALRAIKELPSEQPDRELIEQLRWERDTAIQQLKDLGYGLGEKPKTDDTISRQAAIDAIVAWTVEDRPDIEMPTDLVGRIEALPSAQPEQRWIPCERELPAVGRSVLISVGGIYTAEGCLRDDGDWTQFRWDAIQRKDMVGAWKPLEEPYKGEQE